MLRHERHRRGEQYKARRLELGLTQKELAKRLGVTPMTVSRRERGIINIGEEAFCAIMSLQPKNKTDEAENQDSGPSQRH